MQEEIIGVKEGSVGAREGGRFGGEEEENAEEEDRDNVKNHDKASCRSFISSFFPVFLCHFSNLFASSPSIIIIFLSLPVFLPCLNLVFTFHCFLPFLISTLLPLSPLYFDFLHFRKSLSCSFFFLSDFRFYHPLFSTLHLFVLHFFLSSFLIS